ncbi:MAG: hypothetical protein FJY80_00800 [Candidatus Aminicenantes bacterium]|nr:hypothetical protein [Candidatus Aminicenantes bacterium]
MNRKTMAFVAMAVVLSMAGPAAARQAAPKPDYKPLLGSWALEVNAGGEYYYLTLDFKMAEDKFEGAISEQNGAFSNVALANIEWDGTTLKFDFNSPTPPDGVERLIKSEFKLAEGKLAGMMTIADLGMSVPVTGTKK